MKLRLVDGKSLIKVLSKKEFIMKRQKGSHVQLENNEGKIVTVPLHPGRDIG